MPKNELLKQFNKKIATKANSEQTTVCVIKEKDSKSCDCVRLSFKIRLLSVAVSTTRRTGDEDDEETGSRADRWQFSAAVSDKSILRSRIPISICIR